MIIAIEFPQCPPALHEASRGSRQSLSLRMWVKNRRKPLTTTWKSVDKAASRTAIRSTEGAGGKRWQVVRSRSPGANNSRSAHASYLPGVNLSCQGDYPGRNCRREPASEYTGSDRLPACHQTHTSRKSVGAAFRSREYLRLDARHRGSPRSARMNRRPFP